MTVDLLAHSDLFRAGVATSGSYNKTLTPFGFQNERRTVWAGARRLRQGLAVLRGRQDQDAFASHCMAQKMPIRAPQPLQSKAMYEAIRGNGGTTRLVMLPHEPHWYSALESNEQEADEEITWFDKYVKNAAAACCIG